MNDILVIDGYLNRKESEIDLKNYYRSFASANIFMHTSANNVTFFKKKGGLSIKCAFNGREIYETCDGKHAIDDTSYLILNSGQEYSGYINSDTKVESFSVFFENGLVNDVLGAMLTPEDKLLEYYASTRIRPIEFIEKSYDHDDIISPYFFKMRKHIKAQPLQATFLEEQFHFLLEKLFEVHKNVRTEIDALPFKKFSTRFEIYKRLNKAKDMMDTVFNREVSLKEIALEACLCTHHFIRLFKKLFGVTPHQYLTGKRLDHARFKLLRTEIPVNLIGEAVGFQNQSSFTRLFKNHFSLPPSSFRETHRIKKSILVKH